MKLSLESTCIPIYRNRNNMDTSMLTNEFGQVINKTSEEWPISPQTLSSISKKIFWPLLSPKFCFKIA